MSEVELRSMITATLNATHIDVQYRRKPNLRLNGAHHGVKLGYRGQQLTQRKTSLVSLEVAGVGGLAPPSSAR